MIAPKYPVCPICKKEVLIPLSISLMDTQKQYGSWICTNCGFCISTQDTRGYNPNNDIEVSIIPKIAAKTRELKRIYETQYQKPLE